MTDLKNLSNKGLSLSQAQSISNMCFQRTQDIANNINIINNAEKTVKIGNETYIETVGNKIPNNIVDLLLEKALLHATQAFLMENIKAKDSKLKELKDDKLVYNVDKPELPTFLDWNLIHSVVESWGWKQLSNTEYNEYLEAEAYASHIGQFIHKDSKLDKLRKEVSNIKPLEWIHLEDGKKSPLVVKVHHTSEGLLELYNKLASLHRNYEQRVNYFKAKVKNLVTEENARIARINADEANRIQGLNEALRNKYKAEFDAWSEAKIKAEQDFEVTRQETIKLVANLRIEIDLRFQTVINSFLKQLD
jgi:hypothetical protein